MAGITIYVESGEMQVATKPPATVVLHGTDFTFEVQPTRLTTVVADTRTRSQCEVADTRVGSVGVASSRQWWLVSPTQSKAQIGVDGTTRPALDVAATRVQRNRS
jgi:hypothetical protein